MKTLGLIQSPLVDERAEVQSVGILFLKVILYAVDGAGTELMFSDPVSTCFFIKWWFQAVLMRDMK